jgi:hypothetical protein
MMEFETGGGCEGGHSLAESSGSGGVLGEVGVEGIVRIVSERKSLDGFNSAKSYNSHSY